MRLVTNSGELGQREEDLEAQKSKFCECQLLSFQQPAERIRTFEERHPNNKKKD